MKTLLLTMLLTLVCAAPVAAQVSPGVENRMLETKLPTRVPVYCAPPLYGYPDALGWTWHNNGVFTHEIYIRNDLCADLSQGNILAQPDSYLVLYHEWWHQQFAEVNESRTNTGSLALMRYFLRRYWAIPAGTAQAMYRVEFNERQAPGYEWFNYQFNDADPLLEVGF